MTASTETEPVPDWRQVASEIANRASTSTVSSVNEIALDMKRDIVTAQLNTINVDNVLNDVVQRVRTYLNMEPQYVSLQDPDRQEKYQYWSEDYIAAWDRVSARSTDVDELYRLTASELRNEIRRMYAEYGQAGIDKLRNEAQAGTRLGVVSMTMAWLNESRWIVPYLSGRCTPAELSKALTALEEQGWD